MGIRARRENYPDFKIGFQYIGIERDRMNLNPDAGRDAWAIPVTVTLPIWQNKIRAEIHQAKSRLESSQSRLRQTENTVNLELKKLFENVARFRCRSCRFAGQSGSGICWDCKDLSD